MEPRLSDSKLMIITSDEDAFGIVQTVAIKNSYSALKVNNLESIQKQYLAFKPGIIVFDMHFGDTDGISLLNYFANIQCHNTKLIMIGVEDEKLISSIKHIGDIKGLKLQAILKKPLLEKELTKALVAIQQESSPIVDARQIVSALEQNNFILHYQPKIDLKTKRVRGFEVLVRLETSFGELILPSEFITTSEETGLIAPLTSWIIHKAFTDYQRLRKIDPNLKLAINLSAKNLQDPVFPDAILKLANTFKIEPKNICFEITESGVSHQSDITLEILTRLRVMGFALSIDDFGTGYSSIVELQRLPFTELKIDQRFVTDLIENPATKIIVQATIDLGHNLGLELVAEGVEQAETMDLLEILGCDIAQGFYIAAALPVEDLEVWFQQHVDRNLTWHK